MNNNGCEQANEAKEVANREVGIKNQLLAVDEHVLWSTTRFTSAERDPKTCFFYVSVSPCFHMSIFLL